MTTMAILCIKIIDFNMNYFTFSAFVIRILFGELMYDEAAILDFGPNSIAATSTEWMTSSPVYNHNT